MSSRSASTARRRYPVSARGSLTCRISTGETDISPSLSVKEFETADHDPFDGEEDEDGEDWREVESQPAHAELRKEAPEEADVRVHHVVQEPLHAVQPDGVGQRDPRRDDVREDQEQVHEEERVDELLRRRDG